jgi:sortase B
VDKTYYSGGSIYSQRYNGKTFEDPVTVLYGHNRASKTMFAPVNDYADPAFFDAHPYIYIYMPDRILQYEIFAAYPHSSEHLLLCHDFSDPEQFAAFFGGLNEGLDTNYREERFPDAEDRVLTLSTCYKNNRMQRYLVQGILQAEYLIEVP